MAKGIDQSLAWVVSIFVSICVFSLVFVLLFKFSKGHSGGETLSAESFQSPSSEKGSADHKEKPADEVIHHP